MKPKQLIASLLCITALLLLTPRAAFANSAQKFFRGTDAYGAIVTEENCPITVESELLTFDIPEFPNSGSNPGYKASVTAEYTFFNPADYTVTARLEFPFGSAPDYGTDRNDLTKYDITVNGAAINKKVRHTYLTDGGFEVGRDIAKIEDGFTESDFFSPDLPVTKYVYDIGEYDSDSDRNYIGFEFYAPSETRVYFRSANVVELSPGLRYILSKPAWWYNICEVYVFGEEFTPEWTFYSDYECKHRIEGEVMLVSSEKTTLKALASSLSAEDCPISEEDAYNALVSELDLNYASNSNRIITNSWLMEGQKGRLMRWYEYEITIPPGERIVNTVTAPIYPTINEGVNPTLYRYTYLLSPAQSWADFGSLEVVVNTPYFLRKTEFSKNADSFETTETGYKASFDGLPEGELVFSLRTKKSAIGDITGNVSPWLAFFIITGYVGGIVGICLVVAAIVRRLKK